MTVHEFAKRQIEYEKKSIEFYTAEMKYYRDIIKKENIFIRDAHKDGYTFTTTTEKRNAERHYQMYYRYKKQAFESIAYYTKQLENDDYILFDD